MSQVGGTFLFDVETYPNYFLIAFKSFDNGLVWFTECKGESGLPTEDIQLLQWIAANVTLVGYNSATYDIPMMFAASRGFWCQQLKSVSDYLIIGDNRPRQAEKEFNFSVGYCRAIDLFPVGPNPTNRQARISLKHYGARMGTKRL